MLAHDGYACLYLHPWEFVNLDAYRIPGYTKRHAGPVLQLRLRQLIEDLLPVAEFTSMQRYIEQKSLHTTVR